MQKSCYRLSLIILCLISSSLLFAHKEWVHQHQVKQAYLLLKNQLGFDIPEVLEHMGMNHNGEGPGPFLGCSVVQGAWEEDLYDPVWEVGGLMLGAWSYCGWDTSSTHFWKADAGDYSSINIPEDLNGCPLPEGEIPNAYQKALHYIYGGWVINWKPGDNFTFTSQNGHTYKVERMNPEVPACVTIYYNSLVNLYKEGHIYGAQNPSTNYRLKDITPGGNGNYMVIGDMKLPKWLSDWFVWEIIGRTAHLLGDMSVPCHVHNDIHPCFVQIPLNPNGTIYNEGDTYELYIGGQVGGSNPHCNEPQTVFPAQNITWSNALLQGGGFFNVDGKENPIRYLFYTTNQLADHFGSLSTNNYPSFDPTRWYPGNGSYNLYSGDDYYAEFQQLISTMGPPVTNENYFSSSIEPTTNTAFVYSIRAIASFLYWFIMQTDLLPNTLVSNNFNGGYGGKVKVNSQNYFGYHIPAWGNPTSIAIEATDQGYNNCYWRFQSWEKIQNGTVVGTFNSRTITIIPTANTTYRANFRSDNSFNFIVSGPKKGLYRGESLTYKIFPQHGNPSANYRWWTKYRTISNGQTFWTNGLPEAIGVYFNYSLNSNTATLSNEDFNNCFPCWQDSVIQVFGWAQGCGSENQEFSEIVTLKNRIRPYEPPPPPPPGGCPFVYSWNGEDWMEDNNILPQSQDSAILGQDVTDFYHLYSKPRLEENKYYFAVGEFENEKSYLDQLKLLIVDHPQETFITVNDEGQIIQFAKPAYFASAELDSIDVYKKLYQLDEEKVTAQRNEFMTLSFEEAAGSEEKWLLLIGQVSAHSAKKRYAGNIVTKNKESFTSFRLRKNPSYQWVLVPQGNSSSLQVDILWKEESLVDYTELSRKLELPFTLYTPELINAEHNVLGDVRNQLLLMDGDHTELNPNEWITLEFAAPPVNEGMERSFVFVSRGRYETLPDTTVLEGRKQIPPMKKSGISSVNTSTNDVKEYKLNQNYPNPFNPVTTIHYTIKEPGYVSLKLYDLLGREVATLVNENKTEGSYTINFSAKGGSASGGDSVDLSSGIYVCRIKVNEFSSLMKIVVLK